MRDSGPERAESLGVPRNVCMGGHTMLLRLLSLLCLLSPLPAVAHETVSTAPAPALTPAQLEWAAGRELRVASDPSFAPFSEVTADGILHGVDARVLEAVASHTGLRFTVVPYESWGEAWTAFTKGELDMLTGCASTPEREKVALFTRSYAAPRLAIIAHRDSGHGWSVEDLNGLALAVPLDYAPLEDLGQRLPSTRIRTCQTLQQALTQVATRNADATVMSLASAVTLLPRADFRELRVTGFYDRDFPLRLAVPLSPENKEHLIPVLDSALEALRHQSAGAAYADWVDARLDEWAAQGKQVRRQRTWLGALWGAAIMSSMAGAMVWYRTRRRESQAHRTPEQTTVADGPEALLEKAFALTSIPMLVIQAPDLIVGRNAAARTHFNGAMVLPPELSEVATRLAGLPSETPVSVTWAAPGRDPVVWQARLLPLSEGRGLLTLVP